MTVVHGDSLDRIARRVGTSIDELKNFRGEVSFTQLRIGEKLRYRKMKAGRVIVGWRKWDFATVAARYNGGVIRITPISWLSSPVSFPN